MVSYTSVPSAALVSGVVVHADNSGDIVAATTRVGGSVKQRAFDHRSLKHLSFPVERDMPVGIESDASHNGFLMPARRKAEDTSLPYVCVVIAHDLSMEVHH